MSDKYNHNEIDKKWQKEWDKNGLYRTKEDNDKSKYYILDMFPYPSGAGLHVGHPKGYIATDIFARMKMMQGFNVLHPMGWDAFGLPAENYAIKNKLHPRASTDKNVKTFKEQLYKLGLSYDWEREINTTDPKFYKWTQWIFAKIFERGLAYESYEPINWCPACQTGLANEDLENGRCERCDSEIERKPMRQWVLRITDYADRMLDDLEKLPDWENSIKEMQRNWIGRSEGAEVNFLVKSQKSKIESQIKVFTTRPDTLFGATYMVLAPEHELVQNYKDVIHNFKEVEEYIKKAQNKSDMERTELNKEKTGVRLEGIVAVNPVNGEEIPVYIADYVMVGYGTGAIMAVPAHDERDWEFAQKYDIPIKEVVKMKKSGEGKTILLIHGLCDDSSRHWFPWFKKEFENRGYKVMVPDMPNPHLPRIDRWMDTFEKLKGELDGEIIMVGFSLGTYVLPLFIDRFNISVKKLILVAPSEIDGTDIEDLVKNGLPRESIEYAEDFRKEDINWDKVKNNTEYVLQYLSNDDPFIQLESQKHSDVLNPKKRVFSGKGHFTEKSGVKELPELINDIEGCTSGEGIAVNSEFLDGLSTKEAKNKMIEYLEKKGIGKKMINYKLRDWVFSRQRYWGEPMPLIYCEHCKEEIENGDSEEIKKKFNQGEIMNPGWVVDWDLPLELPDVESYEPSGTGESPLATIPEFVNTNCPKCGGAAKRETNTMPQWAGSSWYYLRYIDPNNDKALVDNEKEKYWSPVDFYVGGAEHATRHLIYARFWHKFLYDINVVSHEEPFKRLQHVGLILAEDGRKMSKRWGNVINPDDIVERYGADAMRVYEMFMGPFGQACAWNTNGLIGARKFLDRVWGLSEKIKDNEDGELKNLIHKTIRKVAGDIEDFKFNTAISSMMILCNKIIEKGGISKEDYEYFVKILSPFAPYFCEEIWRGKLGHEDSIFKEEWPEHDDSLIHDEIIELVVQINGKVREKLETAVDISEDEARETALQSENVKKWIEGREIVKIIFVKGKLLNIVIK